MVLYTLTDGVKKNSQILLKSGNSKEKICRLTECGFIKVLIGQVYLQSVDRSNSAGRFAVCAKHSVTLSIVFWAEGSGEFQ